MLLTLILCVLWMRIINYFAAKNLFDSTISRKLIHIGTGPLFLLCWLLFPDKEISRYLAAVVPFLIVIQVLFVGLGYLKDYTSVRSMARTGQSNELLRGPLFYGLVFVLITIFFWKKVDAVIALMILCGGDGAADLIGSWIKSITLPWSRRKTIIGSLSMALIGTGLAIIMVFIVINPLPQGLKITTLILNVFLISIIATLVESITPSDYDNLTIPVVSLLLSTILF